MMRRCHLIDPLANRVVARCAFKTCEEKAPKHFNSFLPCREAAVCQRAQHPTPRVVCIDPPAGCELALAHRPSHPLPEALSKTFPLRLLTELGRPEPGQGRPEP